MTAAPSLVRTVSLSAPGKLESLLRGAGFREVEVTAVPVPREFASVDEAFEVIQTSSPTHGELTRAMSDPERERYAAELERRLAGFVQPDGRCVIPGEALLGSGTR